MLVHTVVCMHLISAKYMYHAYIFCQLLDGDQTALVPTVCVLSVSFGWTNVHWYRFSRGLHQELMCAVYKSH